MLLLVLCFFFFFNDTATTEIYTVYNTLSLHDALPISWPRWPRSPYWPAWATRSEEHTSELQSLYTISYAVFCLKKKKKQNTITHQPESYLKNHNNTTH